ncbi:F protein [Zobellella denitrificans]|uniref:F protein n=1 Tax=Zobellella denitrificans TaxID=347534 RepID=A0A291HQM7_9GAMM|nr:phage minor head protein [Zobellella denitrificans]ATG74432.1 F protein [Zobellella denitrificans]
MADIDLGYAARLEPRLAVDYFRAKGYQVSWNWQETAAEAHARAFTVAKAVRMDVLTTIRGELDTALAQGLTEREFVQSLTPRLKKLGWWGRQLVVDGDGNAEAVQLGSPHRLGTIYRANLTAAYQAGRQASQLANSDDRPYWQYVAVRDSRTRPSHAALHGRVFRADDPIWQSLYPPNGWGCRCRVRALSAEQVKERGLKVESSAGKLTTHRVKTGVDKRTGEEYFTEVVTWRDGDHSMTPDPGWSHSPGGLAFGTDPAVARKLEETKDRDLRQQLIQQLNNSPARRQAFGHWLQRVVKQARPGHGVAVLGFLSERDVQAVAARGGEPARILAMGEKQLLHAASGKHEAGGIALSPAELARLPAMVGAPDAVFWDHKHDNLVLVKYAGEGAFVMMPVTPGRRLKKQAERLDVLVNAFKVSDARMFLDKKRFERVR